jgi:hypothetical protein
MSGPINVDEISKIITGSIAVKVVADGILIDLIFRLGALGRLASMILVDHRHTMKSYLLFISFRSCSMAGFTGRSLFQPLGPIFFKASFGTCSLRSLLGSIMNVRRVSTV